MVNYKPDEYRQLEALIPALNQGMDPQMAIGLFQGVQGQAQQRAAEHQAYKQQMMADAADTLRQAAMSGVTQGGAMDLAQSYQAQAPGLAQGQYAGRLEDLVRGDLYQGGAGQGAQDVSSLFMPDPAEANANPATATQLDPETAAGIYQDAYGLATAGDPNTGEPVDLHTARMLLVGKLRAMGYNDTVLDEAYNQIGAAYTAGGGQMGVAPLTFGDRDARLEMQDKASALAGQGTLGSFNVGLDAPFSRTTSGNPEATGLDLLPEYAARAKGRYGLNY